MDNIFEKGGKVENRWKQENNGHKKEEKQNMKKWRKKREKREGTNKIT